MLFRSLDQATTREDAGTIELAREQISVAQQKKESGQERLKEISQTACERMDKLTMEKIDV